MRPTFAIIFFTVVSGCGFGLLFFVGMFGCIDPVRLPRMVELLGLGIGMALAAAGLLSSLLHLGQPQRAWRALSQWRSSWLSREGVASLSTFVPALALGWLVWRDETGAACRVGSAIVAIMSVVTVLCTARIYSSLKTIRAWHNGWVLPGYLLFGALSGACVLWCIDALFGDAVAALPWLIVVLAIASAAIDLAYWRFVETYVGASTPESATGLGRFGKVRSFEAPHTEANYLTHEMGFVLARKHAARLRVISLFLFAMVPMIATLIGMLFARATPIASAVSSVSVIAGLFVERWLFFAQAKHVVMLFYATTDRA
ncbi:MAG: DmsC/YnfH family molybdoenzyme membrane anchor subunit [Rudaea sp.]